jgi:hypothetical protein
MKASIHPGIRLESKKNPKITRQIRFATIARRQDTPLKNAGICRIKKIGRKQNSPKFYLSAQKKLHVKMSLYKTRTYLLPIQLLQVI